MDVMLQSRDARFSVQRTRDGGDGVSFEDQMTGQWTRALVADGRSVYTLTSTDAHPTRIVLVGNDQRVYVRDSANGSTAGGWLHRIESPREPGTLDLGPGDGLAPIAVHPGQRVRVHLRASPATGYEWNLETPPQESLAIESDPGSVATSPSPSLRSWGFRAVHTGKATLRFGYRRPWETSAPPARAVAFELLIR